MTSGPRVRVTREHVEAAAIALYEYDHGPGTWASHYVEDAQATAWLVRARVALLAALGDRVRWDE
jgi:hypothetical protein